MYFECLAEDNTKKTDKKYELKYLVTLHRR